MRIWGLASNGIINYNFKMWNLHSSLTWKWNATIKEWRRRSAALGDRIDGFHDAGFSLEMWNLQLRCPPLLWRPHYLSLSSFSLYLSIYPSSSFYRLIRIYYFSLASNVAVTCFCLDLVSTQRSIHQRFPVYQHFQRLVKKHPLTSTKRLLYSPPVY